MIETEDSLEILEAPGQAEGESGSETIGFSTFGAQRINDAQKRRARPTSVTFVWNRALVPGQLTLPTSPSYWGTFITTFDGVVLAGARNDGLGAATGWTTGNIIDPATKYSDGAGGSASIPTLTNSVIGLPGNRCGFDIFINTLQLNVTTQLDYRNPYTATNTSIIIVAGKIPQIGQYTMAGAPAGTPPFLIVRRRPEGYLANEDGAQVFLTLPYANIIFPAGFVNPAVVGVPTATINTTLTTNIAP